MQVSFDAKLKGKSRNDLLVIRTREFEGEVWILHVLHKGPTLTSSFFFARKIFFVDS